MLGELLKDRQAGDIGTGQLNSTQRLTVIQPAEELSDFRFGHSLIIVNREVIILNSILRPFGQLREIQSADIFHAPVIIYDSRGVGSQRKFIMEIFADGIGPLLSVQAVINAVFVTGKVHGGDRIAVDHAVNQEGFFLCIPHKIALYGVVVIDFALLHLIHQGLCGPVDIESLHIVTSPILHDRFSWHDEDILFLVSKCLWAECLFPFSKTYFTISNFHNASNRIHNA